MNTRSRRAMVWLAAWGAVAIGAATAVAQDPPAWRTRPLASREAWNRYLNEPGRQLQLAWVHLSRHDRMQAAQALVRATEFLWIAVQHSPPQTKETLVGSALELEELSFRVRRDAVLNHDTVAGVFARAEHALADYKHQLAVHALTRDRRGAAGHYLRTSTAHLMSAAYWAEVPFSAEEQRRIAQARELGADLLADSILPTSLVEQVVSGLGAQVRQLGDRLVAHVASADRPTRW